LELVAPLKKVCQALMNMAINLRQAVAVVGWGDR